VFGKVISVIAVFIKAREPIFVNFESGGIERVAREVQPSKTEFSILVTVRGNDKKESRLPKNARPLMQESCESRGKWT
jgi:hypothetical protein